MKRPARHGGLHRTTAAALRRYAGGPYSYKFVAPEVSDYLLKKLRLPPETIREARMVEAHQIRVVDEMTKIAAGAAPSAKSVSIILERLMQDLPACIERSKQRLPPEKVQDMLGFGAMAKMLAGLLKERPDAVVKIIPAELISFAGNVNHSKLEQALGERKFNEYIKARNKTIQLIVGRGKRKT